MEAFRAAYSLPKTYLILVDKEASRQMIVMNYLGGDDNISYERIIGHVKGEYKQFGVEF